MRTYLHYLKGNSRGKKVCGFGDYRKSVSYAFNMNREKYMDLLL